MKKNVFLAFAMIWFVSCSTESTDEEMEIIQSTPEIVEENPVDDPVDSPDENTDITNESNLVTFTGNIQAIITSNCITCHTDPPRNGAPFPLLTFEDVDSRSANIFNQVNAGFMPPSGKLSDSNIDLIEQWIADGKPE